MISSKQRGSAAPAVDKALDILEYVADHSDALSGNAIIRDLGMPAASGFRIINALAARGYLRKENGTGALRLGIRALKLGRRAYGATEIRAFLAPLLAGIRDRTRESVELAWLAAGEIVILDVAESPEPIQLHRRVGTTILGLTNPITLAIASFLPVAERKRLLTAIRAQVRSRRKLGLLPDNVTFSARPPAGAQARVRACGYASDYGKQTREISRIAVPILDGARRAAGALSVAGPRYRLGEAREQQIVSLLRAGANDAAAVAEKES